MVSKSGTSFEERVGKVLLEAGFVTAEQLEQASQASRDKDEGLLDALVSTGVVARETLMTVLSFQLRIPVADLRHINVDPEAVQLVPEEFARQNKILPYGFDPDGSLRVATMVPNDFHLSTQLSSMTGRQTKFALALSGGLDELIDRTYYSTPARTGAAPAPGMKSGAARAKK